MDPKKRTALLLIHGIGVQNRFDFLASFVDGFVATCKAHPEIDTKVESNARFLGRGKALNVTTPKCTNQPIDVFECYWSPLMTGATNVFSVLGFMFRTVYRTFPWNADSSKRAPKGRFWRWLYTTTYLVLALGLLALMAYWTTGAFFLATDRAYIVARESKALEETADNGQSAQTLNIQPGILTPHEVDLAKKIVFAMEQRDNLRVQGEIDRVENSFQSSYDATHVMTPTVGVNYDKEWQSISDAANRKGARFEITDVPYMTTSIGGFLKDSLFYISKRSALASDENLDSTKLPKWPNLLVALTAFQAPDLIIAALLVVSLWTIATGSLKTLWNVVRQFGAGRKARWSIVVWSLIALVLITVFMSFAAFNVIVFNFVLALFIMRSMWGIVKLIIVDTVGDVEIYAQRDANSKKYLARAAVLDRATKDIDELLDSDYEQIVIAAHSLGSVVGIEAIRRLYHHHAITQFVTQDDNKFSKIKAFITFGSPLDKFSAFFAAGKIQAQFDELNEEIDEQIFKRKSQSLGEPDPIPWYNFYNNGDIIGEPLSSASVAYQENVGFTRKRLLWTHSDYWYRPKFCAKIAEILCNG